MATLGIPPNGFQGSAAQSHAVRNHVAIHMGSHSSRSLGHTKSVKRRRKKPARLGGTARRSTGSRKSGKARGITILKAGSAAAKAWGAKMKRLRKAKAKPAGG